jgi:demethylmenaquinone methyltransferase/2-methoxy-6-polyprenyl-1,4-benzoquinol methylase
MTSVCDFFNEIANSWDDMRNVNVEMLTFLTGLMDLAQGDKVLDIGSGTGVLLPFIYQQIGSLGMITAVDFSEKMLQCSERKFKDLSNISFKVMDIMAFQNDYVYDKVSCLNFFPHVQDKPAFLLKIQALLKPGGVLFIMHDISREAVNAIHGSSEGVREDRLPEGSAVGEMLSSANFRVETMIDNEQCYFIKAVAARDLL